MSELGEVPVWAAIPAALLLLLGSGLALIGSIGLIRMRSFYERVHTPTLGTSMGVGSILLASMIVFTSLEGRLVIHELLIMLFMLVTTPVTLMLLARAALYRDRQEGSPEVPRHTVPGAAAEDRPAG